MNRFIRYFNQNRKKIIISVAIIAFIIIIIRIIDSIYAKINISKIDNIIVNNENQPTESVITGETVSQDITSKNQNEIDNFINYCNNKQYNQAYELLTHPGSKAGCIPVSPLQGDRTLRRDQTGRFCQIF